MWSKQNRMQTFFDALRQVLHFEEHLGRHCIHFTAFNLDFNHVIDAFEGVSKFPTAILRLKKMLIKAKVSHPEKFIHKFNVGVHSQCKLDAKSWTKSVVVVVLCTRELFIMWISTEKRTASNDAPAGCARWIRRKTTKQLRERKKNSNGKNVLRNIIVRNAQHVNTQSSARRTTDR